MKIVVLGGGISTERHVSLVTATSICKALRSLGHKAIFVDMYLGLEDYDGTLESAFDAPDGFCKNVSIEHEAPNISEVIRSRKMGGDSHLGVNVLEICKMADCVFLGLHGADGEDGKIQATLDLLGVKYTGSGSHGSAMAMDKSVTKMVMKCSGIPTPEWKEYTFCLDDIDSICDETDFPCVVKVVNGGSSIGVYFPNNKEELINNLKDILKFGNHIIIEQKIKGREFTLPVLDGKALSAIEIIPPDGTNFDYIAKYQSGDEAAREICPADISSDVQNMLGDLALRLNKALGLSVYSRTDFILDEEGNPWCLEVNTLPGMTPTSLIPQAAKLEGLEYADLCEKIVELSLKK